MLLLAKQTQNDIEVVPGEFKLFAIKGLNIYVTALD